MPNKPFIKECSILIINLFKKTFCKSVNRPAATPSHLKLKLCNCSKKAIFALKREKHR